jgi:hypothetical protein
VKNSNHADGANLLFIFVAYSLYPSKVFQKTSVNINRCAAIRIRIPTVLDLRIRRVQKDPVEVEFLFEFDRECGQIRTSVMKERPVVIQTTTL